MILVRTCLTASGWRVVSKVILEMFFQTREKALNGRQVQSRALGASDLKKSEVFLF
jgi:hypothetical protein